MIISSCHRHMHRQSHAQTVTCTLHRLEEEEGSNWHTCSMADRDSLEAGAVPGVCCTAEKEDAVAGLDCCCMVLLTAALLSSDCAMPSDLSDTTCCNVCTQGSNIWPSFLLQLEGVPGDCLISASRSITSRRWGEVVVLQGGSTLKSMCSSPNT